MTPGRVRIRRCDRCEISFEIYHFGPGGAIVVPVAVGTWLTHPLAVTTFGAHWWTIALAVVVHLFAYTFFHSIVQGMINSFKKFPDVCPQCGGSMETSAGFADRVGIGADELLATAHYLALMFLFRLQAA